MQKEMDCPERILALELPAINAAHIVQIAGMNQARKRIVCGCPKDVVS